MAQAVSHPALYWQKVDCPVCRKPFQVERVRLSRLPLVGRDSDFRLRHEGLNIYYYSVWVCPRCAYAAADQTFRQLSEPEAALVRSALAGRRPAADFNRPRDWDLAFTSYRLAIYQADKRRLPSSVSAGLHLRAAWLLREKGERRELDFLDAALHRYLEAYDQETFPIGKMDQPTLEYLIGELYRRIGRPADAMAWFARVVEASRTAPKGIVELAREGWHAAKETSGDTGRSGPATA